MGLLISRIGWAALAVVTLLAGCGGHSSPSGPSSAPASNSPSHLFLADAAGPAIGSLIDANPPAGTVSLDRVVAGADTGLGMPSGTPSVSGIPSLALDTAADRLYVSTQDKALVFDQIGTASGNVRRARAIQSTVDGRAVNFGGLYVTSDDVLYVVEASGAVRVFNDASALDGTVTPDRTITPGVPGTITGSFGLVLDARRDMLYVGVVSPASSIIVFNAASTASTATGATLPPDRKLDFALGVGSFFVDEGKDILYVSLEDGVILVFDGASKLLTGTPTPSRLMTLPVPITTSSSKQFFITVDTDHDRLYAVNGPNVFIVNGASSADDPMLGATKATLSSTSSLLSAVAVRP